MITNRDVHSFWNEHDGPRCQAVQALCARHDIAYDANTMGSTALTTRLQRVFERCKKLIKAHKRNDPYMDDQFELRVMPANVRSAPTPEQNATQVQLNKELKRKVYILFCLMLLRLHVSSLRLSCSLLSLKLYFCFCNLQW